MADVYDSIGADFFLSPAPGWLNLGLWDGRGEEAEAEAAVIRLVETLAEEVPKGGVVLDVGNGLGAQDVVIADVCRPAALVAVNITESQLRAGKDRLRVARAAPVVGDAVRLPFEDASADGVVSVEAAFHFRSRARFFAEARRVLRRGGVLSFSDVTVERKRARTPGELVAGLANLRVWGLRAAALQSRREIVADMRRAGFADVRAKVVSGRVFAPAINLMRARLDRARGEPALHRIPSRILLAQWELLYRRSMMDYVLLRGTAD